MLSSAIVFLTIFATTTTFAGKRGLCWPWYNKSLNPGVFNNGEGEVVAIYDYETYPPISTNGSGGLEFIGMQRCTNCTSSPIDELHSRWQRQGWATVFTLNEPDGTNVSASEAASWYIKYINPLPIKKALPAVTSSGKPGKGLSWASDMITACAGQCYFDYINLHWYGGSFSGFQSYVESAHSRFPDHPLVITEFALHNPPGGEKDQVAFFRDAFPFLDNTSYVELYFPFVATSPSLFKAHESGESSVGTGSCLYTDNGTPSAVGELMFRSSFSFIMYLWEGIWAMLMRCINRRY